MSRQLILGVPNPSPEGTDRLQTRPQPSISLLLLLLPFIHLNIKKFLVLPLMSWGFHAALFGHRAEVLYLLLLLLGLSPA